MERPARNLRSLYSQGGQGGKCALAAKPVNAR